jgi:hypothetical protein
MILNAINSQFVIYFPPNFFYPEVVKKWMPVVKRLKLPYVTMEDFINSSIQSIDFPSIELEQGSQQQSQFPIKYRGGKELEPVFEKNLTITFKLAEGFISYWIFFEQIELYLKYGEAQPFWPPMYVSFLDHHGFELVAFSFEKIVPTGMSQFQISYATTAAEFNTFTLSMVYNRFKIKRRTDADTYDIKNS